MDKITATSVKLNIEWMSSEFKETKFGFSRSLINSSSIFGDGVVDCNTLIPNDKY